MKTTFQWDPLTVGTMRWGKGGAGFSTAQYQERIEACLAMGLRDFDHADIYGGYTTEAAFGKAMGVAHHLRAKLRLITKCGIKMVAPTRPSYNIKSYDLSPAHIENSVEQSLKNFKTDYLDVLLLHRPDFLMDYPKIARTFKKLHQEGKVLHFGVSNFSALQFERLNSLYPLVTNQVEISLLHRHAFEDGTLQVCHASEARPMAWSPLGGGQLFQPKVNPKYQKLQEMLQKLSNHYHCAIDELMLAFLLKHPAGIIPVLGTTDVTKIERAKSALDIALDKEDWYAMWQAATGEEIA